MKCPNRTDGYRYKGEPAPDTEAVPMTVCGDCEGTGQKQ